MYTGPPVPVYATGCVGGPNGMYIRIVGWPWPQFVHAGGCAIMGCMGICETGLCSMTGMVGRFAVSGNT